jgi:CubicO group peptidase (beta-lactamase class C family)
VLEFANANLFSRMDFRNQEWMGQDASGIDLGGYGIRLRPIDMLKFGQLYLQRGLWKGQRISIFPEMGLAVTLTGVIESDESGFYEDLISQHVLYSIRGESLNENAASFGELQLALGAMRKKKLGLEAVESRMRPEGKNKGGRLPWRA